MNNTIKQTRRPKVGTSGCSALESAIIALLSDGRERSTAEVGSDCVKFSNGNASNPGTLAAAACLRRMEKKGIAKSRRDVGPTHYRTQWRQNKEARQPSLSEV
jgi:DNA-binding PadR family transcriptional regulator